MAIRDVNKLRKEREDFETTILGLEARLLSTQDENQRLILQGQIAVLRQDIDDVNSQIEQAEIIQNKRTQRKNWAVEQPLVDRAIDENHMGYIAPLDQFIYCRDYGSAQSNVQFKMFPSSRIVRMMNKLTGISINGKETQELISYFESKNRNFLDITASFNKAKWDEQQVYNKMSVIHKRWIQPDYAAAANYNRNFDVLIQSVCGGKQENIDHLEQWVAFKYLYPERNANTPNIDLGGNPGGNGKGRFVEVLKTIFTPACVIQAHREELEKFNANWEMAVILYYDEPEEKELAASKLKQATGAEDMRIEKKGIDATMADRNYNFVFMSNNQQGVVKLSGGSDGGEDRRYSVINTDIVLFDLLREAGYADTDSRNWLNDLAQNLVKNREEVARWLAHIIVKHNVAAMSTLPALHGEDYHSRFETQKDAATQAFDLILPEFQRQGCLPLITLTEFVRAYAENNKFTERGLVTRWETYLKRNRVEFETLSKQRYTLLWNNHTVREPQGKIYVVNAQAPVKFELSAVFNKKPNYDSIVSSVIQKTDIKLA